MLISFFFLQMSVVLKTLNANCLSVFWFFNSCNLCINGFFFVSFCRWRFDCRLIINNWIVHQHVDIVVMLIWVVGKASTVCKRRSCTFWVRFQPYFFLLFFLLNYWIWWILCVAYCYMVHQALAKWWNTFINFQCLLNNNMKQDVVGESSSDWMRSVVSQCQGSW